MVIRRVYSPTHAKRLQEGLLPGIVADIVTSEMRKRILCMLLVTLIPVRCMTYRPKKQPPVEALCLPMSSRQGSQDQGTDSGTSRLRVRGFQTYTRSTILHKTHPINMAKGGGVRADRRHLGRSQNLSREGRRSASTLTAMLHSPILQHALRAHTPYPPTRRIVNQEQLRGLPYLR